MATKSQLVTIAKHGRNLLAIFPNATERDPVTLCKKLRRLEEKAAAISLRLCNGPEYREGEQERLTDALLLKVNTLLGNCEGTPPVPVFLDLDPRGYSLKIDDEWTCAVIAAGICNLHSDFGGYGILAPEIET